MCLDSRSSHLLSNPPQKKAKTAPTATVSIPDDLGVPADFTDQTPQLTVSTEVHKTDQPTPKVATSTAFDCTK